MFSLVPILSLWIIVSFHSYKAVCFDNFNSIHMKCSLNCLVVIIVNTIANSQFWQKLNSYYYKLWIANNLQFQNLIVAHVPSYWQFSQHPIKNPESMRKTLTLDCQHGWLIHVHFFENIEVFWWFFRLHVIVLWYIDMI